MSIENIKEVCHRQLDEDTVIASLPDGSRPGVYDAILSEDIQQFDDELHTATDTMLILDCGYVKIIQYFMQNGKIIDQQVIDFVRPTKIEEAIKRLNGYKGFKLM